MVFLLIALILALAYLALKPLADGLLETSAWAAKVVAPSGLDENDTSKQIVISGQVALMQGWLSNLPFVATICLVASVVVAFFYHWWASILIFLLVAFAGIFARRLFGRSVSYYLIILHRKMRNRAADYKRDNDVDRAQAAQSYCLDLEELIEIYYNSRLRPPTPKELKTLPYGARYSWLDYYEDRA